MLIRCRLSNRPWSMLRDILWFNATAIEVLRSPEYEGVSTGDYLAARGYSEAFQEDYLLVSPAEALEQSRVSLQTSLTRSSP
jgi:predicted NAD/FAD-binding protein